MTLRDDFTDTTPTAGVHAQHHDDLADNLNVTMARVAALQAATGVSELDLRRTAAFDIPDNATLTIANWTVFRDNSRGDLTLQPDGTVAVNANGAYYLAVNHFIPGLPAGANIVLNVTGPSWNVNPLFTSIVVTNENSFTGQAVITLTAGTILSFVVSLVNATAYPFTVAGNSNAVIVRLA